MEWDDFQNQTKNGRGFDPCRCGSRSPTGLRSRIDIFRIPLTTAGMILMIQKDQRIEAMRQKGYKVRYIHHLRCIESTHPRPNTSVFATAARQANSRQD